jgi:hypothetical protein
VSPGFPRERGAYRAGVLQRCLRDINAAAVSDSAYERLGQILLGFPDVDPMG